MKMDILKTYNQTNHFGPFLGMKFKILESGEIRYDIEVKKEHLGKNACPLIATKSNLSAPQQER